MRKSAFFSPIGSLRPTDVLVERRRADAAPEGGDGDVADQFALVVGEKVGTAMICREQVSIGLTPRHRKPP
jgi:hypothetical protein